MGCCAISSCAVSADCLNADQEHPAPALQVLKLAKKAAKRKQIKRGVKEVIKAIRKNVKGCAA